jgi:adenylosuccinate synthase
MLDVSANDARLLSNKTFLWYLCTPYSHNNPNVVETRYRVACQINAVLLNNKIDVISPIVMFHEVSIVGKMKNDYKTFREVNEKLLSRCDGIIVAEFMAGWDKSVGVIEEIKLAETMRKFIVRIEHMGNIYIK